MPGVTDASQSEEREISHSEERERSLKKRKKRKSAVSVARNVVVSEYLLIDPAKKVWSGRT